MIAVRRRTRIASVVLGVVIGLGTLGFLGFATLVILLAVIAPGRVR